MKKYEILIDEENTIEFEGHTLHRIKALRDFGDIKIGDLGGYVENENNLSHEGNCWIYDDAKAMDYSVISDNSRMYNNSKMYDYSIMHGNSTMYEDSEMHDEEVLYGKLASKVDEFVEISITKGRIITGVLKDKKILYNIGCQSEITKETFIKRIYNEGGGIEKNPHRKSYLKIIDIIEAYFSK